MSIIPLDLRQQMLPFIKKGNTTWSFKNDTKANRLFVIPKDYDEFKEDISNKMVYTFDKAEKNLDIDTLLKYIPSLHIREYTQDVRLELIFTLVDALKKGYNDGMAAAKDTPIEMIKYLGQYLGNDLKNITGVQEWKNMVEKLSDETKFSTNYIDDDNKKWVIDLIYSMYCRILTTQTTNNYTVPISLPTKISGNGTDGWNVGTNLLSGLGSGNKILEFIAPSFQTIVTPMWKGSTNNESVQVNLSFNLFNDSFEKSINNFIFVHTLIPQNLPLQYAILSQPPSLYDIRVDGGDRLFMCSGKFTCENKGVLRKPRENFYKELQIYCNKSQFKESMVKDLYDNNYIKIPDIYTINMEFTSLLPNNFNTWLFKFANGNKLATPHGGIFNSVSDIITDNISKWVERRLGDAKREMKMDKAGQIELPAPKHPGHQISYDPITGEALDDEDAAREDPDFNIGNDSDDSQETN